MMQDLLSGNAVPPLLPMPSSAVSEGQGAAKRSPRFLSTYGLDPTWERVRVVASSTPARFLILPLAKFASLHGIAIGDVDEGVLTRIVDAARAGGNQHPGNIAINIRRGIAILREVAPDLGLQALPKPGRGSPRKDQQNALPDLFEVEVTSSIDDLDCIEKPRFLSTYKLDPTWEHVRVVASSTPARFLILPLAKFASLHGIAIGDVDEGVLTQIVEAARAEEHQHPRNIAINIRRGVGILREIAPELGFQALPKPGRASPRKDQWNALPEPFKVEITSFIDDLGRIDSSSVTAKNTLLRAIYAAEAGGRKVECLADLFSPEGIEAVLRHTAYFGAIGVAHASREDFLCLARHHAEVTADLTRLVLSRRLLADKDSLPGSRSPLSPKDLLAVQVLMGEGAMEQLVAQTVADVYGFVRERSEDNLGRAQLALSIRLILALSLHREKVMRMAFEGLALGKDGRPTLSGLDGFKDGIEDSLSPETIGLLDCFHSAHSRSFGGPGLLFAHPTGEAKDDSTLSEGVRRFGRRIGLVLSPTILRSFTVACLIRHQRANPDDLDLTDIKNHLGIDQRVNFESRFGPLLDDDVYKQLERSADLDRSA